MLRQIGFHTNLNNFLTCPLPDIHAIQVFIGRPISFLPSEFKDLDKIKTSMHELGLTVYIHSPYVYSLNHIEKSLDGINRMQAIMKLIGSKYMVLHCQGEHSLSEWVDFVNKTNDPTMILLENMAKGTFKTLSELEHIANETGCGICIDTAHLWNSGDITRPTDWNIVKLVHCNVTDGQVGSKKDNHTNRSISVGNMQWIKEEILSNTTCDIITEVSNDVNILNEIQLINTLII